MDGSVGTGVVTPPHRRPGERLVVLDAELVLAPVGLGLLALSLLREVDRGVETREKLHPLLRGQSQSPAPLRTEAPEGRTRRRPPADVTGRGVPRRCVEVGLDCGKFVKCFHALGVTQLSSRPKAHAGSPGALPLVQTPQARARGDAGSPGAPPARRCGRRAAPGDRGPPCRPVRAGLRCEPSSGVHS